MMKLNKIIKITGKIIIKTGFHIGAGDTGLHIGGTDKPVVRHPYKNEPYIPGSSLKGKIRSLLELKSGLIAIQQDGSPISAAILDKLKDMPDKKEEAKKILQLFGVSAADKNRQGEIGPSRASFADAYLSEESKKMIKEKQASFFEIKSENTINRISAETKPRFIERVVEGLKFDFSIYLKEMEGDKDLLDYLLMGIKLLEFDALGASGSRGYGKVKFEFDDCNINDKFKKLELF